MKKEETVNAERLSRPYLNVIRRISASPDEVRYELNLLEIDIEEMEAMFMGVLTDEALVLGLKIAIDNWVCRNLSTPAAVEFRQELRDNGVCLPHTWNELNSSVIEDMKILL